MSYIQKQKEKKISQWRREAEIAASRAIQKGIKAWDVVYPSGIHMKRFAEPFSGFGMHYEIDPETWDSLVESGGVVAA